MTILIFSCNRALQLQTLLDSLIAYLTIDGRYTIHVIYAASDQQFERGYQQLQQQYPTLQLHREAQQRTWAWPRPTSYWKNSIRYLRHSGLRVVSNFKSLTEQLIADSLHEGVMFLTDDSLFVRPVHLDAGRLQTILTDPVGTYSLSLRHGLTLQPLPAGVEPYRAGGYVWQTQADQTKMGHWAWRFSVDGHVYPRRFLLPVLYRLHYANPNSLEGFVNEYVQTVRPELFSNLLFNPEPGLVGFILNKVQTYNGNRSFDVSPAFLNEKFLSGYKLRYRYRLPVHDFQPTLKAIDLINSRTKQSERLVIGDNGLRTVTSSS